MRPSDSPGGLGERFGELLLGDMLLVRGGRSPRPCEHSLEPDFEARLWEYAEGEMEPEDAEEIARRLETCPWCAHVYREIAAARLPPADAPGARVESSGEGVSVRQVVKDAIDLLLRLTSDGIEALCHTGRLAPVAVPSRGGGSEAGVRIEQVLGGMQMKILVSRPADSGVCRLEVVAPRDERLAGARAELYKRNRRILVQPFSEEGDSLIWRSERVGLGSYELVVLRGRERIGSLRFSVLEGT